MAAHPRLDGAALRDAIRDAARCRANRFHRMELIPGDPSRRPMFGVVMTFRCELCGTIRYDNVQRRTGELLARSYDQPDWYRASNEGGEDPAWWRAKWWEQLDDALFVEAAPLAKPTPIRQARKRRTR
jgi:hypothetical protein